MFEGWVYQLVAGYLGNYIKDIHREQFRIGLWSGVALVENAELRLEAFDYLQLPFAIKQGFVGKLRLQIPWKTLFWEPILIALEDVYICACPRDESEFDVEASENRAMAAKKAKLAAAEITKLSSHVPDEKVRESFLSHVLAKFIANIQVTVRNIHIRYVDDKDESESNFDFGAKLSGLTVSTDARGSTGAGKNKGNLVYKSVELKQFSIYWNSAKDTAKHNTGNYLTKWFTKKEVNLTYILNPMDASANLTVNRSAASEGAGAQYALIINMKKLDFNLGNCQLYEMFLLLESLKVSQLRERYGRFRPRARVSESVREWWVYAINAVRSDAEKRLRRTSWKYLGWRLECRHRYVALYIAKLESLLEGKPPGEEIVDCLEALEKELDMDMILSFRSLAEEKCELGTSFAAKEDSKRPSEDANIRSRGWLSRFSFGMLGGSESMDAAAEVTGPFSDEIMKDLYEATNFHPSNPHPSGEWSKGYSLMAITLQLQEATAKLDNSEMKHELVEVRLGGICVGYRKLQGLSNAALAVKSFAVMDLCTIDSSFPRIVSQKALNKKHASPKHVSYAEVVYGGLLGISQRELSEAAFTIDIELSDGSSSKISLVVKPLEIVYMPHVISYLLDFFKLPALRVIDEGNTEYSKARAKLIVTVVLKSPTLLIPERSTSGDCAILIVALESVRVTMSDVRGFKELKEINPTLLVDSPLNSALKHFEIRLTGLQIGIGKGTIDSSLNLPFWSTLVDSFDVQTNILKYRGSLGNIHYQVDGNSGDLKMAVSAESCKTLITLLSMVRVPVDDNNIRVSKPSSSIISAQYSIKTIDLQVHINENPSAPLKGILLHLDQLDLKVLSQGLERNMELSVASFCMDSMDHPKHSHHSRLFSMDSVFTMKYILKYILKDEVPSSEVVLHLQRLHGEIYPVIIRELTRFFGIFTQDEPEYSHKISSKLFTLRLQLDQVSFAFYRHPSERALATISLQKSSFILSSSDSILQSWQLEGNATELQLTGPEFATQEVDGIPYGNYGDKPSILQLRLQKRADIMDMVINLRNVKCILLSDYLAVIIGLIKSPDWTVQEQRAARGESSKILFQYTIDVKNSLLILPTGGRGFTKLNIPEFRFSYVPPELAGSFRNSHLKVREDVKIFYIIGKHLSLSDMECSSGNGREYSLINCLDGEIIVEVPMSSHIQTTIHLVFPVIELFLFGKEFLGQIERVKILSSDLATVGKKSKHANSIWECLNTGKTFVMETTEVTTPKEAQEKPTILFNCSVDSFHILVYSLKKDNVSHIWTEKKIMAGEVGYVSSFWCVKQGILDRFEMETTNMKFIDEGKKLVSTSSQLTVKTSPLPDLRQKFNVLLPSVYVGLELASWSRIFSWIFLCFPVVPSLENADHVNFELSDNAETGVRVTIEPQPAVGNLVLEVDISHVSFCLPEREHTKMICTTCSLRINSFELSGNKCKFSACLTDIKAETMEEKACGYPCLLGGNIQVKGDVEIDAHVAVELFFVVNSIDCCCSYPVLQFLNDFKLEQSEEEDSFGLDIGVRSFCDITSVSLLLTDGRWNYNCPLLELILANSSLELSWTIGSLQLMISSMLEISYHNIQKAVWEPFLEPWRFLINFMKTGYNTNLEVNSSSNLNINITEGLSQAVRRPVEMIRWKFVDGTNSQEHFSQYAPYWFQNDTGTIVAYTLLWPEGQSGREHANGSSWCTLMPGCSVPLFVDQYEGLIQQRKPRWSSGVSERKKIGLMSHRRMRVQLEGTASASLPMSIDLVGKRPFEVVFSRIEGDHSNIFTTHVLFEVSLQHHSKLIRLYSTVTLTNMTSLMLEARLEIPFGIAPKIMEPILPDEVIPLPVHLAETGQIRLRPYGRDLLWSEAYSLSKLIASAREYSSEHKNIPQRPVLCYPQRPSDTPFRCTINVQEKPVYSVENHSQWNTWNFLLQAPLIIKNGLPCAMDVAIASGAGVYISTFISKGDSISVYEVDIINDLNMECTIPKYNPSCLNFTRANIQQKKSETGDILVFNPEEPSGRAVYARVQKTIDFTTGRREIYISVQYWIYNCSGLDLVFVDYDVEETTEQVLHGTPLNKGVSISSKGLQSLLAANGNGLKQAGLRIHSHLPSRRVLKHSQRAYSSSDISNNVEYTQEELTPYLYSPAHTVSGFEVGEHKIQLRMFQPADSAWTPPFLLDPPGGTSPIIIPQPDTTGAYVLSMCSMPAMGACSGRTKTITFRPRFVLANASRKDICLKQQGTDIIHHLPMGQNMHVHWTDATRSLLLSVRYNEHGWDWSGGFALDRLGDTQVKAHNHLNGEMEILRVEVMYPDAEGGNGIDQSLGTFYIIVTNDETGFMPYRIDNFSSGRLRFYQERCEKTENILQPYSSCDYAWDEPCLPPQLVIEVPGEGGLGAYELENVKTYPPVHLSSSLQKYERRFVISVHAEGARRVLSVADLSLHTQKDPKPSTLKEKLTDFMEYATEKYSLNLTCIGISLVDSTPQELVFASARELSFQLAQSDHEQDVKLEITGLQVDNQLRHAAFPVMLSTLSDSTRHWSTVMNNGLGSVSEKITESPTLSLVVSKWRRPTGSVDCFQCIYLSVAPLCLELEERSLIRLITFLRSLAIGGSNIGSETSMAFKVKPSKTTVTGSLTGLTGTPLKGLRFVEITEAASYFKSWPSPAAVNPVKFPAKKLIFSAKQKRKVYIEAFCIDLLELTISFSSIPWLPKERRGESILFATGSLLQRRLIALADVEGAPIRLRQLALAHPMANWNAIFGIVQRHYTRQLLHEVYKVLGSADVFGNPMSFMRSLGSGMYDFVSAPARSIRQNPVYVVQGVRLGTKSLFRNTIFAFSNAATQMSKAARKGVAVLALDQDYLNEHEINDEGIWSRDSSIVNEFLEGLTGLLQSSVRGAERHGIPGVFSGIAVGVLRAIARPAASMLEVAGKTALSIRNSSRPVQQRNSRVRLPRHLEQGSPLLPYSWNEALGMAVLLEAENGHLKEEAYVTCQSLVEPGVFVLLTENLLMQVKCTEVMEPKWNILSKNAVEDILYIERSGETIDVLFCTYSGSRKGLTPSLTPFKNVSLQLDCSQAADELHHTLVRVISQKHGNNFRQVVKLNGQLNLG